MLSNDPPSMNKNIVWLQQALTFYSCKNLRVEDLRIKDSQQIHVLFEHCTDVEVSRLTITAPSWSPNTDGIHVTSTKNILITHSVIGTGKVLLL